MSLNANTITVDNTGTANFPQEPDEPAADQPIYLISAAPVILGGQSGVANGATIPANVLVPVPGKGGFLRAPSTSVQVSYYYQTNTGG